MTKQMDRLMLVSVATLVLVILIAGYAFNLLPENLQFALIRRKDLEGLSKCTIITEDELISFNEEQCGLLDILFAECADCDTNRLTLSPFGIDSDNDGIDDDVDTQLDAGITPGGLGSEQILMYLYRTDKETTGQSFEFLTTQTVTGVNISIATTQGGVIGCVKNLNVELYTYSGDINNPYGTLLSSGTIPAENLIVGQYNEISITPVELSPAIYYVKFDGDYPPFYPYPGCLTEPEFSGIYGSFDVSGRPAQAQGTYIGGIWHLDFVVGLLH